MLYAPAAGDSYFLVLSLIRTKPAQENHQKIRIVTHFRGLLIKLDEPCFSFDKCLFRFPDITELFFRTVFETLTELLKLAING